MNLTTWNCARGFGQKKDLFFSTSPDIAVIQECSKKSTETLLPEGYAAEWTGDNPNIGMGVFFKKKAWDVRPLDDQMHGIRWITPFTVTGPESFLLVAVWACEVKGSRRESYIGQINRAIEEHPDWFNRGTVVVAGDFNSNACWDLERRDWNHSTMVKSLQKQGLASVYHATRNEAHGKETKPTFHLQRNRKKPYHIDYIFAPELWRSRMEITLGECEVWLNHSDHCPLVLRLKPVLDI